MTFGVNTNFEIPLGRIIQLHGRPVRQIELSEAAVRHYYDDGILYLMVEADGSMWLWDGSVDP